jgi:hypothetical protein
MKMQESVQENAGNQKAKICPIGTAFLILPLNTIASTEI